MNSDEVDQSVLYEDEMQYLTLIRGNGVNTGKRKVINRMIER